jgi:hypothetical protein
MNNRVSESHQFATLQSIQSAKLFLKSSELGLPQPLTSRRVYPPPPLWFLWGGGVLILTRGHTLWYSRYICTLWFAIIKFTKPGTSNSLGLELRLQGGPMLTCIFDFLISIDYFSRTVMYLLQNHILVVRKTSCFSQ